MRKLIRGTCFLIEIFSVFFFKIFFGGSKNWHLLIYLFSLKNCHYLFFKRWSSLCLHFCMISVLLFRDFSLSAYIMKVFSSKQSWYPPDSLLQTGACLAILHLMSYSIFLFLSFLFLMTFNYKTPSYLTTGVNIVILQWWNIFISHPQLL